MAFAGLPPALGFLPILPAMPHARQSFGLFASAETFLSDPLNRLSRAALPALPAAAFAFGFTHGGLDPAAAPPAVWGAGAALLIAKPAAIALALFALRRARPGSLPALPGVRAIVPVALAGGLSVSGAALLIDPALPGGALREGARVALWVGAAAAAAVAVALGRTRGR